MRLKLGDGSERTCDHVLLGTGYRVDVSHYSFLSRSMEPKIRKVNGFPVLDFHFESSIPKLHFVGADDAHLRAAHLADFDITGQKKL